MKTEKVYIVITRYVMQNKNIGMVIANTFEDAMKEAKSELDVVYTESVEIYEADKANYYFFGKQIFKRNR